MNGWIRLWIFLSVIWAVIILGTFGILIAEMYRNPDGPWVYYQLSDEARSFLEDSKQGERPTYSADIRFEDGTITAISFPLLTSTDVTEFEAKVRRLAEGQGTQVHRAELGRFFNEVMQKNKEAAAAALEYREALASQVASQEQERAYFIKIAALSLGIPPLLVLALGYGIAWIRRGFQGSS